MSWFDHERFAQLRIERGVTWGRPVRALDEVSSTNDCALEAIASDARTGIVWLARRQTQGRGRRGRDWESSEGCTMMMSLMVRAPRATERLGGIPLAVGLAVRAALARRLPSSGHEVQVKWPNDVMVEGKKIAGILVESRSDDQGNVGLVIGVGLNLERGPWRAPLEDTACCLADFDAQDRDQESLLADLLFEIEQRLPLVFSRGFASLREEFSQHDFLRGRPVEVEDAARATSTLRGVVRGVDERGRLQLVSHGHGGRAPQRLHTVATGTVVVV